ncbi:solute carrier, TRAMD3 or PAT1-domain-containing protein [Chytridium lagenaria]|nr:solute carrier, TRAMD3 or PAT1-domain-containing protein [Chytridium lagenaria]
MSTAKHGHSRPHDYLYDPNYTVSSNRDHVKAMMKSQTHDVIINPLYENMFSALRHFPPSHYRFRAHSLPENLGNDRHANYAPPEVDGTNRYKYFRRPIIPYMPSLGGQVVYAKNHRESEAQTDPYSPEYVLPPNATPPELLALATLTYGLGLPAGMAELEMIERARSKRAWESTLPKVVDQESFEKRLKMMEEMELKEWQEREDEIRRLQEARLQILTKVIAKREEENEAINNERVERIWQRKLQEREAMLERIERKRVKGLQTPPIFNPDISLALRKLGEKRNKIENKIERRDIIAEYANYSSRVYAPKARDGVFQDKATATLRLNVPELDNLNSILELESTLSPAVLNANISLPDPTEKLRNPTARRELHMQEQLKLMDEKLKERKHTTKLDDRPLRFAERIEKPPLRPPTPKITPPSDYEEEMELSSLLLQKLIRGRISQNLMYQGKERRLQLINELRTRQTIKRATEHQLENALHRHAVVEGEEETKHEEIEFGRRGSTPKSRVGSSRKASGKGFAVDYEEDSEEDVTLSIQEGEEYHPEKPTSEYVGRTLDFLSKEIVRLREERRISAMVKLAERTRKLREAEEKDRREAELQRRREEDEVFRQIMHIHQETVESYLEDVISGSIDQTASIQARMEVREYAEKINTLVDQLEQSEATNNPDRIVKDLVVSFLIPEVEKETLRNKIKEDQRRFLLAAHKAIYADVATVEDKSLLEIAANRRTNEKESMRSTLSSASNKGAE